MTPSRKRRRPIVVNSVEYLWWIREDDEPPFFRSTGHTLHICSADGAWLLHYHLGQDEDTAFVEVLGRSFGGIELGGTYRRFRSPPFGQGPSVSPGAVAEVIRWSLSDAAATQEVNYFGLPLS